MATKAERQAMYDELQQIKTRHGGVLRVDDVIDAARDKDSPLHEEFTWDLKEAALITWRQQARQLIASFEVTYTVNKTEYTVQEFVETPAKGEKDQGYVGVSDIKDDKAMAREFMARELGIAATYVTRAQQYAAILGLDGQTKTVVKKLSALRAAVGKSA